MGFKGFPERSVSGDLSYNDKQIVVTDMIKDGRWEENFRRRLYANEQLEWDLMPRDWGPVPTLVDSEDEVTIMEDFSIRKCYKNFASNNIRCNFDKFLWRKQIPSKVFFILWAIFNDSLLARDMLTHRGITLETNKCVFCNS